MGSFIGYRSHPVADFPGWLESHPVTLRWFSRRNFQLLVAGDFPGSHVWWHRTESHVVWAGPLTLVHLVHISTDTYFDIFWLCLHIASSHLKIGESYHVAATWQPKNPASKMSFLVLYRISMDLFDHSNHLSDPCAPGDEGRSLADRVGSHGHQQRCGGSVGGGRPAMTVDHFLDWTPILFFSTSIIYTVFVYNML